MKKAPEIFKPLRESRGVVLLIVLFVIVLLVSLVVEFDYQTRIELKSSLRHADSEKSVFLARSGLLAGEEILRQSLSSDYDGPDQMWAREVPEYPVGEGVVSLQIGDESGKINLNQLNQGQSARAPFEAQIRKLFQILQVEDHLVDEIVAWMACDNSFYYQSLRPPYSCRKNQPMEALSDLRLVRGVTDEIYNRISPYLTVYPKTAASTYKINVNTADRIVLQTLYYKQGNDYLFDVAPGIADEMIRARPVKSANDLASIPGLKSIGDALKIFSADVKSQFFTIAATSSVHGVRKKMTETIDRPPKAGKISRYFTRLD